MRVIDFRQPSILEQVTGAINSYGLVGTLAFAASIAMVLYVCFSAIFKERPAKNTTVKRTEADTTAQPDISRKTDASPPRNKRD